MWQHFIYLFIFIFTDFLDPNFSVLVIGGRGTTRGRRGGIGGEGGRERGRDGVRRGGEGGRGGEERGGGGRARGERGGRNGGERDLEETLSSIDMTTLTPGVGTEQQRQEDSTNRGHCRLHCLLRD